MATFAIVHGGGDSGWGWHLVVAELERLGHRAVAPDLPADGDDLELTDYADTVLRAIGALPTGEDLVVVGHSYGAFTVPFVARRVAGRVPAPTLVLVSAMVPAEGEAPDDWWAATGRAAAVREQAAEDGGLTGHDDPYVSYYHDVPRELADEAQRRERAHPSAVSGRRPMPAWPDLPTRYVVCSLDRLFPPAFSRRLARERLGVTEPDEVEAGHMVALSRPRELAALLASYVTVEEGRPHG